MAPSRADLVVVGQVVVAARPGNLETAEAIGIADGRVVAVGDRQAVLDGAAAGARVVEAPAAAVVPGLHDFHLHLVGMARARREVNLDDAASPAELGSRIAEASARLPSGSWLLGGGWLDAHLTDAVLSALAVALGDRPALLYSHDRHSTWASPAALRQAGIGRGAVGPAGGRVELDDAGEPTGVLREKATDLVDAIAERLRGPELEAALDETLAELAGWGITAATDAGDTSAANGVGPYAAVGDRPSLLLAGAARLDGRLRLGVNVPAAAIEEAAGLGLRTGAPVAGARTIRAGWAKAYADGALGSRTAALFEPYTCGDGADAGILRLASDELDEILAAGRRAGIGLAVHAIGDRAVAGVLDAFERAPKRDPAAAADRIEHLQLVRPADVSRLAMQDVTASVQPIHGASDRDLADHCWADRAGDAYPWRSLASAGARLAFGSDGPVESANPWLGLFAAVHRRFPGDGTADWRTDQALDAVAGLSAYTLGPALAQGLADEGHLGIGAHADLAVLDVDLATLLAADERLADVRSVLTLVGGVEVHR